MKYDIEKLQIAQVSSAQLGEELTQMLEGRADFEDTDKTLKEYLVSTGALAELLNDWANIETELNGDIGRKLNSLYEQVKDFGYLHVTKI